MSRRDPVPSENLKEMISDYFGYKSDEKTIKTKITKLNTSIKETIKEEHLPEKFSSDDFSVSMDVRENIKFNELRAIDVLKYNLKDNPELLNQIVKTKEYIDDDQLESALYNNAIDPEMLRSCNEKGEDIVTLRITKKKGK